MRAGISGARWTETRISPTETASDPFDLFAVAAPGLDAIVETELRALGMFDARAGAGGVAFKGRHDAVYRANLHLRTASRVLARIGEFGARGFPELVRHGKRLPWERFLDAARPVQLRVTCHKSRLYHSDAVRERVAQAIASRLGVETLQERKAGPGDESGDAQLVIVRMAHDRCLLSADTSGELLHRRGYREATAKAPIRETLAAALLLAAGWRAGSPLVDPFCGSGTIAIEAALMARRIAPGLRRRFAFMSWPDFDELLWTRLHREAEDAMLPGAPAPIQGSDRDAGAVESARANAARAGVESDIGFDRRALSAIEPPAGPGWICTNPPYGVRVSERAELRNLYAQLGNVLRTKCAGWELTMFSADARLERATRLKLRPALSSVNGGIPVRVVRG
ncbi:MAG: class I SAM-dependent RNA methyltransferase, partial [Gemmatimonadota bacterium]|nr:class I SAM-dependent RNA methyltransferase [Gemmatimonadota bacterium]